MCRVEYQDMVNDDELQQQMEAGPTVPCRFDGCPVRNLRLSMIIEHEKVCEHVRVRCRYAPFGCSWKGKRVLIQEHEETDCRIAPVGPMVEQFRRLKTEMNARLEMTNQNSIGATRLNGITRQDMVRSQSKSSADVFQILHYCHCVTCSTPVAILQREKWKSFWMNDETRASVVNFLVFLPFLIPPITIGAQGLSAFCLCLDKLLVPGRTMMHEDSNSTLTLETALHTLLTPQIERLIETSLLGFCTSMFGVLAIALNFTDENSSKAWKGVKLGQLGTLPIIGDIMGVCIFALFMCILEYHDGGVRGIATWALVLFSATFFPACILTLSRCMALEDPPSVSDIPTLVRSIEPLMFGLRYSSLGSAFGVTACLDAALIVAAIPRSTKNTFLKDCVVGQLPHVVCVSFLGFKLALWGSEAYKQISNDGSLDDVFSSIADSLFAAFALRLTNEMAYGLFKIGIGAGCSIAAHGQRYVRPEGVIKDYSLPGILAFGVWSAALFATSQI